MGVNNGPMWMAILMNAPVALLKPTTEIAGCYNKAYYNRNGLPQGSQFPTSPNHQQIFWEDDSYDSIIRAFEKAITCQNG